MFQCYFWPKLCPSNLATDDMPTVRIMTSRLLGKSSMMHMSLIDEAEGAEPSPHLHARVHGGFLPKEGDVFAVGIDPELTFVFAHSKQNVL